MRSWTRWTARAAMVTASFVAAGAGTVGIASAGTTSGNNSILGGNQISVPVSVPVNVCGNALAVLGDAFGGCQGGASVSHGWGGGSGSGGSAWTSGNNSIGGGNQVSVPVSVPVNVCGNALAVLDAAAAAGCQGGALVSGGSGGGSYGTSGDSSILGGNQVRVPVKVPVNVCGNAAAVLGSAFVGCQGGAWTGGTMATSSGVEHMLAHTSSAPRSFSAAHVVRQSAVQLPDSGALSGLSSLPVLSGLPIQASQLSGIAGSSSNPVQASLLSAQTAPGMGSGSLIALAIGALLAGAAALVAAGRRFSARRASL